MKNKHGSHYVLARDHKLESHTVYQIGTNCPLDYWQKSLSALHLLYFLNENRKEREKNSLKCLKE